MDNQHRQIKGYGELTQEQIDLINEIKAHGEKSAELIARVAAMDSEGVAASALETAKVALQTGNMWLVKATSSPTTF